MPTFNERLKAQNKRLEDKLKQLERLNKTIETARENIKAVNREIGEIRAEINVLETRILTEAISQKGISISELAAAIKSGQFDNGTPEAEEKPPDITELNSPDKTVDTYINSEDKTAENGVTINDKEEIPDETGDSRKTVGGS